jgi:hypothetical protein
LVKNYGENILHQTLSPHQSTTSDWEATQEEKKNYKFKFTIHKLYNNFREKKKKKKRLDLKNHTYGSKIKTYKFLKKIMDL